jgi:hypothetical protein
MRFSSVILYSLGRSSFYAIAEVIPFTHPYLIRLIVFPGGTIDIAYAHLQASYGCRSDISAKDLQDI